MLLALGYWGYRSLDNWLRWVVMLLAPIALAAVWATLVAMKSSSAVTDPWRLLLEIVIFGAGAAALAWVGRTMFTAALTVLAVVHLALTFVLDQRHVANGRLDKAVLVVPTSGSEGS